MSSERTIINEEALINLSYSITLFKENYRETIEEAIRELKSNADEWNDEDFNCLVSAISSFMTDVEKIENQSDRMIKIIEDKINAIRALHSMNI